MNIERLYKLMEYSPDLKIRNIKIKLTNIYIIYF